MRGYKIFTMLLLLLFFITACHHDRDGTLDDNTLIENIKDIEISTNQLFNLDITFDEYKRAFSDKFVNENTEEKYVKENDFLFAIRENDSRKLINRGQLNEEMIGKLKEIINPESFSCLRRMDFSIPYDDEDKKTIYVKNIYEYSVCKMRSAGKVKADKVLKIFHFAKSNSQWKIASVDEIHQEYLYEDDLGNLDWVVNSSVLHQGEEIKYITSFEKVEDQYVEKALFFKDLTLSERKEILSDLEGENISIGRLLEEVFPEIFHTLSMDAKEMANSTEFCWQTDIPYQILKHISDDPFTPVNLEIENICD